MGPSNPDMGEVNTILAEWRPEGPGQINLSIEVQKGRLAAIVGATEVEQEDDMEPPPITKISVSSCRILPLYSVGWRGARGIEYKGG